MATNMQRTNVYLSAEDRVDADYICLALGLPSMTSAIRMAIRRAARDLRADEVRDRRAPHTRAAQEEAAGE